MECERAGEPEQHERHEIAPALESPDLMCQLACRRADAVGVPAQIGRVEEVGDRVLGDLHVMCLEPDPPREVDRDHDRRGLDERPARAGRCDERRGDERGQREALALVLRQRAGAEEERGGRQQPRCAGAQPGGQAGDAEGDEHRQRDVGGVRRQLVEEGRSGHDREQRAREQERVGEGAQERPRAPDERDREAEQLQVEQGAVEASEEAEVDRFERRQQQRVLKGGIGRVGEDRRDRVAEVEQGPGTRPPDLPAVRLEQRLDGRRAWPPGRRRRRRPPSTASAARPLGGGLRRRRGAPAGRRRSPSASEPAASNGSVIQPTVTSTTARSAARIPVAARPTA